MSKKLTFQEIILTLQQFWNDQGCMLMQAYDNEKGAGDNESLHFPFVLSDLSHGCGLCRATHVVLLTVVTEKTLTVSTNTTNSRWL